MAHPPIRWGRIVLAALFSEVAVIAVLGIVIVSHRLLIAPGGSDADYQAFVSHASYYVAPMTAGIAVFFGALWAARRLTSGFLTNGTLVGVAAVILTVSFLFVAKPEERLMYGASYALRILGGYLGGVVAQRLS